MTDEYAHRYYTCQSYQESLVIMCVYIDIYRYIYTCVFA